MYTTYQAGLCWPSKVINHWVYVYFVNHGHVIRSLNEPGETYFLSQLDKCWIDSDQFYGPMRQINKKWYMLTTRFTDIGKIVETSGKFDLLFQQDLYLDHRLGILIPFGEIEYNGYASFIDSLVVLTEIFRNRVHLPVCYRTILVCSE